MNQSFDERQQNPPLEQPLVVENRGRWSNMGRKGKCCLGCGICTILTLAVVIPVVICVIIPQVGPKLAQHILDNTVISLPNTTLNACGTLYSWVHNNAELQVPGPLFGQSATLHPYTQEVWTTLCGEGDSQTGGWACDSPNMSQVGNYTSPEMSVGAGSNVVNFSAGMALANSNIVLRGLIIPTFINKHKAPFLLRAKDVSVSVLGFKFSGLTMSNDVTCTAIDYLPGVDIPNSVCYPNDPTPPSDSPITGYYLSCVPGLNNLTATPPRKDVDRTPNANAVVV